MQIRFVFRILAVIVAAAILILSLIPKPPSVQIRFGDKIGHFIAYMILSLLLFLTIAKNLKPKVIVLIILSLILLDRLAALDNGELPQYEALLYQLDSSFIPPVQRLYPHKNALQTYEKSASVQICVPEPARII